MKVNPFERGTPRPARVSALGLGLLGCALASAPAQAAPIVHPAAKPHSSGFLGTLENWFNKQEGYVTSQVNQNNTLFGFGSGSGSGQPQLAGGLGAAPSTPAGQEPTLTPADGLLAQTPRILALEKRRALDPARFDALHPKLGPILAEDQRLRAAIPGVTLTSFQSFPAEHPASAAEYAHPAAAETAVSTPEPGTAVIALALIGSVALARRLRRRV